MDKAIRFLRSFWGVVLVVLSLLGASILSFVRDWFTNKLIEWGQPEAAALFKAATAMHLMPYILLVLAFLVSGVTLFLHVNRDAKPHVAIAQWFEARSTLEKLLMGGLIVTVVAAIFWPRQSAVDHQIVYARRGPLPTPKQTAAAKATSTILVPAVTATPEKTYESATYAPAVRPPTPQPHPQKTQRPETSQPPSPTPAGQNNGVSTNGQSGGLNFQGQNNGTINQNVNPDRRAVIAGLQAWYNRGVTIQDELSSANTDKAIDRAADDVDHWYNATSGWLTENMTPSAQARFSSWGSWESRFYGAPSGTTEGSKRNDYLNRVGSDLNALDELMHTAAFDKP